MVTKFQADRVEFRIVVAKTRPEETVAVSFLEELDKKTVKDLLRKFEGGWGIRSPNELKSVFKTILSDVTKKERDEVLSKLKKAEELAPNDPDEAFSTLRRLPDKYKLYDVSVSFTREGEIKDFDVNCCSTPFVLNLRGKPKGVESLAKLWDAMVEIRKEAEGEGMRGHVQNRIAK